MKIQINSRSFDLGQKISRGLSSSIWHSFCNKQDINVWVFLQDAVELRAVAAGAGHDAAPEQVLPGQQTRLPEGSPGHPVRQEPLEPLHRLDQQATGHGSRGTLYQRKLQLWKQSEVSYFNKSFEFLLFVYLMSCPAKMLPHKGVTREKKCYVGYSHVRLGWGSSCVSSYNWFEGA